jgi:hypothetical protein
MATANHQQPISHRVAQQASTQQKVAQYAFLGAFDDALNLMQRYQQPGGFRSYVRERLKFIAPIGALMAMTSLGCAAATVLYIGGTRPMLVLLSILLVPFVLLGSFFVQAYVFGFWLENRALAKALRHSPAGAGPIAARLRKAGINVGAVPRVPWVLAALFLLLPLAMLTMVTPWLGILLIVLLIAAPVAYARLDR